MQANHQSRYRKKDVFNHAAVFVLMAAILWSLGCSSDSGSATDPGFGYTAETVSASVDCIPVEGTLPFSTRVCVTMTNLAATPRTFAARIDLQLANGTLIENWRFREVQLDAHGEDTTCWQQSLFQLGSLLGDNYARLTVVDITPPPYNQPPYPGSGDSARDTCHVEGTYP